MSSEALRILPVQMVSSTLIFMTICTAARANTLFSNMCVYLFQSGEHQEPQRCVLFGSRALVRARQSGVVFHAELGR